MEDKQKQIEEAVELLRKNFEKAKVTPYVQRPLTRALYQTWKAVDRGMKGGNLMRDRLVDLINEAKDEYHTIPTVNCCKPTFAYYLADRLLANGGILPPCNVGDIVYMVTPGGRIHEKKVLGSKSVVGSNLRDEIWVKHSFTCESALVFNEDDIGKTVFLTREEAERALKGEHNAEIH